MSSPVSIHEARTALNQRRRPRQPLRTEDEGLEVFDYLRRLEEEAAAAK